MCCGFWQFMKYLQELDSPVFIIDLIPKAWSVDHRQLHPHAFLLNICGKSSPAVSRPHALDTGWIYNPQTVLAANRDWWTWSRWFWGSSPPGRVALTCGSPWTWTACSSEWTSPGRFVLRDRWAHLGSLSLPPTPASKRNVQTTSPQDVQRTVQRGTSAGCERCRKQADLSTTHMSAIMQKRVLDNSSGAVKPLGSGHLDPLFTHFSPEIQHVCMQNSYILCIFCMHFVFFLQHEQLWLEIRPRPPFSLTGGDCEGWLTPSRWLTLGAKITFFQLLPQPPPCLWHPFKQDTKQNNVVLCWDPHHLFLSSCAKLIHWYLTWRLKI